MSLGHGAQIVRDGLVLHLDAANVKSYPGSGTTWTDLSGNGNHGVLSGTTHAIDDKGVMVFDASSDTCVVEHNSTLNFSSLFTVLVLVKVNSFNTSTIYNIVSKKPTFNNTSQGWSCQYDYRTTGILQYRNNDATSLNDQTPTSSINNTYILNQTTTYAHSAWVINNSNVSFYINAQFKSTHAINFTNTDSTTNINIGKTVGSVGDPSLFMNLSYVQIYNRELTASEISQNFEATRGRYGI